MAGFAHTVSALDLSQRKAREVYWQSLAAFNVFRLLSVIALLVGGFVFSSQSFVSPRSVPWFLLTTALYTLFAVLFAFGIAWRKPMFDTQLAFHVAIDVAFIVSIMYLMGGIKSGLGLLLLPYLAAAGLIARGRMTLFHAALATIVLLSEETRRVWVEGVTDYDFTTLALLCVACFAVAWSAHRLARYAQESQKLAEQRRVDLAKLDRLNQRILEDVSDGVLVVDDRGCIRQSNPQADRLIGRHTFPDTRLSLILPALATELERWRADKQISPALVSVAHQLLRPRFVALSPGFGGAVLIYLEDMDRLRRESQQVKLAALGRLTANLAHEIRNPLSAISHAAQILGEESRDPLIDKLTRIIGDNARRLERMVKDVLELNRRDRVQMTEIVLGEWLSHFLDEFKQVEHIAVALRLVCPADVIVRFDQGHLHQVLWNLARNGWRYCRQTDDSLAFSVQQHDGYWSLDISNDGPPVPPDAQSQLFEPFFTTDAKGTGLGLYIAREICQANAAQIEYLTPPSGGVCFRITFGINDGQKTY
ncbi:MAG: ATP-binding protein [Formivibrio sp.]|nr:ATP-binding protein [Formivibrio sp.]